MGDKLINGLILTPLDRIEHPKGSIYHAIKKSDKGFYSFGEAYFSSISYGSIKGWKKHGKMILNLIVLVGEVEFVLYDERNNSVTKGLFFSVKLSKKNYQRLTVPVDVWMAFRGIGKGDNILLNIASIEHDPNESINIDINSIRYKWCRLPQ